MNFEVAPIVDVTFGARVTGLKLTEIDKATFADLYQTWLEYECNRFELSYAALLHSSVKG